MRQKICLILFGYLTSRIYPSVRICLRRSVVRDSLSRVTSAWPVKQFVSNKTEKGRNLKVTVRLRRKLYNGSLQAEIQLRRQFMLPTPPFLSYYHSMAYIALLICTQSSIWAFESTGFEHFSNVEKAHVRISVRCVTIYYFNGVSFFRTETLQSGGNVRLETLNRRFGPNRKPGNKIRKNNWFLRRRKWGTTS